MRAEDEIDAPVGLEGTHVQVAPELADRIDPDLVAERLEHVDVGMSPPLDSRGLADQLCSEGERGADVICDRYLDSSLAYQGIARGLGVDRVLELNLAAIRGQLPDRTFLLLIDAKESQKRVGDETDRIEGEDGEFREKVDEAYRLLAEMFPQRIEPVDGTLPPEDISILIYGQLRQLR